MIYRPSPSTGRIQQCEILSNLTQMALDFEGTTDESKPAVNYFKHPFVVILTQDCDLESDFKFRQDANKGTPVLSVLCCEATEAGPFRTNHKIASDIWKRIHNNKDERYQFLRAVKAEEDQAGKGMEELLLDFKRYFTIPTDELYFRMSRNEIERRVVLQPSYCEHLSTRFFYFQYRVALPEDHFVTPPKLEAPPSG